MDSRKPKLFRQITAMLLCVAMLVPLFAVPVSAEESGAFLNAELNQEQQTVFQSSGDEVIVVAGSDFQPSDDSTETGKAQMSGILEEMAKDFPQADGFLFCGDYDYSSYTDADQTAAGKQAVQDAIQAVYGSDMVEVYVQGNHDPDSVVGSTLTASGANDAEDYGVYVINEKDYMWYNNSQSTVQNTANALDEYLDNKVEEGYSKPIFVVSHLPLHYSMRTKNDGDGQYANYIFDVLNKAGAEGLNIIFLFGHNHSNGWDDYLGGSAIYLTKGDSINIAQASRTEFNTETLNFTYMNAGYVGYYADVNTGSETDLTMTVFRIIGDEVTIARYSADGIHDLKSAGVTNSYKNETAYSPDARVYSGSRNVQLNQIAVDAATGVIVAAPGITGVTATKGSSQIPEGYSAYLTYDIIPSGYEYGIAAMVTLPVDDSFDASSPVQIIDHETGGIGVGWIEDGSVSFTTTHFSQFTVAQAEAKTYTASGTMKQWGERVTEAVAGNYYVITTHGEEWVLTGTYAVTKSDTDGLLLEDKSVVAGDPWYYDGTKLRYGDTEQYLFLSNKSAYIAELTTANEYRLVDSVWLNDDGTTFTLQRNDSSNFYLNQYGGNSYDEAAGYTADGNANQGSKWYLYKLSFDTAGVSFAVTPSKNAVSTGDVLTMIPEVLVGETSTSDYSITWSSEDTSIATVDANGVVTPVNPGKVIVTATLNSADGGALTTPISLEIPVTVYSVDMTDAAITATTILDKKLERATLDLTTASGPYVIYSDIDGSPASVLTGNEGVNSGMCTGLELVPENDFSHVWYYDGEGHLLYGTDVGTDNYLANDSANQVILGEKSQAFDTVAVYDTSKPSYNISNSAITTQYIYLNQYGGASYNAAGMYSTQHHSQWYFYSVIPERTASLTVSPRKDLLAPGESVTLTPVVKVDDSQSTDYTLTWTSSDPSLATVDANGKVTAVSSKGGFVIITATLTVVDGDALSAPLSVEIPVQTVSVSTDSTGITASLIMDDDYTEATTELVNGRGYVITQRDSGWVLTNGMTTSAKGKTGLELKALPDTDLSHIWYYETGENGEAYLVYGSPSSGQYLVFADNKIQLGGSDSSRFDTIFLNGDNKSFTIGNSSLSTKYMNQYGGDSYNAVYVYSATGTENGGSAWIFRRIVSNNRATLKVESYQANQPLDQIQKLSAKVWLGDEEKTGDYDISWYSSDSNVATVSNGIVTPVATGDVVITAKLNAIADVALPEPLEVSIPITISAVQSAEISGKTGITYVETSSYASINQYLNVTYPDGSTGRVPVRINMLTDAAGKAVSTAKAATFENLTVTYAGIKVCMDFTLHVLERNVNDYPEFPAEGAVSVDKVGYGIDFQSSGIAQIELSATGVPSKKGADVIIMLDTSSSMNVKITGSDETRLQVLTASLNNLMNQLQEDGFGGTTDIRVAIADFNGYYLQSDSTYYINPNDTTVNNVTRDTSERDQVYTGSKNLTADAFVDVHDLGVDPFYTKGYTGTSMKKYTLAYSSGTNYDYAFDAVYQLGEAVLAENEQEGQDRDLFVIFMSDGCPFQYNYFSSQSNMSGSGNWNNWLLGTFTEDMYAANANRTYYNEDGLHWMAEAIKGDPETDYPVIRKNDPRDTDGDDKITVKGLGATMYSIGFCLADDGKIKEATMDTVIRNVASDANYYYRADTADELENAFSMITNEIFYAATSAYFIDEMGIYYDIQLAEHTYEVMEDGTAVERTITPKIQVKSYSVYTNQDFMNGLCTESQIGTRKTDAAGKEIFTLLEEVTFNADGTQAYSNVIGSGTNILKDGLICANTFWYNTTSATKTITVSAGKTYALEPETFYWKLGTISTTELALSYYVYLTESLEGNRSAGVYDTNDHAELYYVNYLGNDCVKDVPTPRLPWKQATVGFGYYLVDENGKPVINQTTGETGSFAQAVRITKPVYEDYLLNSEGTDIVAAIKASESLPDGYTLFDSGAAYSVTLKSNGAGSYTITVSRDDGVETTYVVGVETNAVTGNGTTNTDSYATANTVVWFGVVATVKCVPDTVVIDYGLPVDIHPLINDLMMPTGTAKLAGIGPYTDSTSLARTDSLNSGFVGLNQDLAESYGVAKATESGEMNTYDAAIRYTLNDAGTEANNGMQMETEEVFTYAVHYTGSVGTQGYYYSTVTVVPATTIYYEDSFLTYSVIDDDTGTAVSGYGWTPDGETQDKTQAEDRPGEFSLSYMDANNIYGHDSAYKSMSEYSLGSAMKVNVGYKYYDDGNAVMVNHNGKLEHLRTTAKASFTFFGTGFDVVSLTSDKTGTILVEVQGESDKSFNEIYIVDTYYGYEWGLIDTNDNGVQDDGEEYGWIVNPDADNTLYQVPVMQVDSLPYGKYTATIIASWAELFDHEQYGDKQNYDFYLDAIRIYDPANDGEGNEVIEDAYVADGEGWPEYFELRDLLISRETFEQKLTDDSGNAVENGITGIVFIDNSQSSNGQWSYSVEDYTNYGPNNEVYIAPGQAISFDLNVGEWTVDDEGNPVLDTDNIAGIHISLKSVGGEAMAKIHNARVSTTTIPSSKVSTATDLYYDITVLNGKTVVIYNTGEEDGAILSVTNIKVTYKTEHVDNAENTYLRVTENGVRDALNALEEDGLNVSGDTKLTPQSATLSLEDEVHYNIYFSSTTGVSAENMGLLVWDSEPASPAYSNADQVYAGVKKNDGKYKVTTDGIPAKEMGDTKYFMLYAKNADGTYTYSELFEYSAKQYALSRLANSNDTKLKNLCVALLNYGAAAQTYFNYRADDLMNASLTDEQEALVEEYDDSMMDPAVAVSSGKVGAFTTSSGAFSSKQATVSLGGALALNFYFTPSKTTESMTMYYWTSERYASVTTLTADNASGIVAMDLWGERFRGNVENIAAKDMDKTIYVCGVYTVDGTTYCTGIIPYSIGVYCEKKAVNGDNTIVPLAEATAVYGYYAKTYFAP